MHRAASFFIDHPRFTYLVLIVLVAAGIMSAVTLRRQGYPPVDFDMMMITTVYPGASPKDVEVNVTNKIEKEVLDVGDIDEITSMSMEDLSIIVAKIDVDARDSDKTKNDIRAAVDRVSDLPAVVTEKPRIEEIRMSNIGLMGIGLIGDASEKELRAIARSLETVLKGVEGVGLITRGGYRKREIHIEADHDKLQDRYVSLAELMSAIRARNVRTTGGTLNSYVAEKKIVTFSEYEDPLEVKDVIIRSTFTGKKVQISDVADVREGFDDYDVIRRMKGKHAIELHVRTQEGADIIEVANGIRAQLEEFRARLPENVAAKILYDTSAYTKNLLTILATNGLIGFVLIMIVLFFFLDSKTAFWVSVCLPVVFCVALVLFHPFGITINYVSLIAMVMVIGILVDDAIVFSEKIYQYKEQGLEPVQATREGLRSMFKPVLAAIMTTVLAFIPVYFIGGVTGKLVAVIPTVVIMLLAVSLMDSTMFLPCHVARIRPLTSVSRRERIINRMRDVYRTVLYWCLQHRIKVAVVAVSFLVMVFAVSFFTLKFVLFPQIDPDVFMVIAETSQGTSQENTEEAMKKIEAIVDDIVPEESAISIRTFIGHHDNNPFGLSSGRYDHWAKIAITLRPAQERDVRSEDMMEEMKRRFKEIRGFDKLTIETQKEGPPVGKPVELIFTTADGGLRAQLEKQALDFLTGMDGVFGVESSRVPGKEELRLVLDYGDMAKLGITALDVARTVRAAFEGEIVTSITQDNEEVDFRVSLADPEQYRAEGVLDLLITNKMGKLIPLGSFARIEEDRGLSVIHHYDGEPAVIITAEVDTDTTTSQQVNDALRKKFRPQIIEHAGLRMEIGGEGKKTQETMQGFVIAFLIAFAAIYLLLVLLFDSYVQPVLIMCAVPFASAGVLIALMSHNMPMSFLAMIGLLGLTGVVVNDSIVMVKELDVAFENGEVTFDRIVDTAKTRFRPILLTTLTTTMGLIPTVYGFGGDFPFITPMVLAIAWGLIFALPVSLILLPVLYSVIVRARVVDAGDDEYSKRQHV